MVQKLCTSSSLPVHGLSAVVGQAVAFEDAIAQLHPFTTAEQRHRIVQRAIELSAESFHCVRPIVYLRHLTNELLKGETVCGLSLV